MSNPKISTKAAKALSIINRTWEIPRLRQTKTGRVTDLTVAKHCANILQSLYQSAIFTDAFNGDASPKTWRHSTSARAKVQTMADAIAELGWTKHAKQGIDFGKYYTNKGPSPFPRQWVQPNIFA